MPQAPPETEGEPSTPTCERLNWIHPHAMLSLVPTLARLSDEMGDAGKYKLGVEKEARATLL